MVSDFVEKMLLLNFVAVLQNLGFFQIKYAEISLPEDSKMRWITKATSRLLVELNLEVKGISKQCIWSWVMFQPPF